MGDICMCGRLVGASLWAPVEAEAHTNRRNCAMGNCVLLDLVFIVSDSDSLEKDLPSHRSHQRIA